MMDQSDDAGAASTGAGTVSRPPDANDGPSDDAIDAPRSPGVGGARSARWAAVAFGLYLLVAFGLLVFHFGRDHWFAGDDWGLIIQRRLGDPSSWMEPQNGHWLLLPTLINQLLFKLVGVRSYVPYQAVVVALHLGLAALTRLVMRRAGVGPWTATIVAGTFVLLGAAYEEMLLVIMMGPLVTMVFGYIQLILSDHDGGLDRRDVFGLLAGLVALSSSGLGPILVIVVGLATLLRRGWRAAAFHTVPLGAVWLAWYAIWGSDVSDSHFSFSVARRWLSDGWSAVFTAIGGYSIVAVLLGVVFVGGLVLAWSGLGWRAFRREAAVPAALVVGAVLFFVITSAERAFIAPADSSRYIGWTAAMILPALGVAAFAFIERWRVTAPFILVLFVIGVPRAIDDLSTNGRDRAEFTQRSRNLLLAAAYSPAIDNADGGVYPDPNQRARRRSHRRFLARRQAGRSPAAQARHRAATGRDRVVPTQTQPECPRRPGSRCIPVRRVRRPADHRCRSRRPIWVGRRRPHSGAR